MRTLLVALRAEPARQLRDFAFESLVGYAEAKALPELVEARGALYPDSPDYASWPKRIHVVRYIDNSGSLLEDNITSLKEMGFRHTKSPDGSHTFLKKGKSGKREIEITIPPVSATSPQITEHVGDPDVQVIEYCGHAGHGNFFEKAFDGGAKSGAGQLIVAYQCSGEGNCETLERSCPDAQFFSTTAVTSDDFDFVMQRHMYEGFLAGAAWNDIMKPAVAELKRDFSNDGEHDEQHWEGHYMAPNTRSILVKHYDRDGDGVPDEQDHIFNVIYPQQIDDAGGFDPVAQSLPRYALDGRSLSKAVTQVSLLIRYNKLLPPAIEAKLPWRPERWLPGGFFEPAAGDLHAFRFTRDGDGGVRVALSTRFAHTHHEDLGRMLALEAGYWLGEQADLAVRALPDAERKQLPPAYQNGVDAKRQAALGVVLLERMAAANEQWYQNESGLLDEAWAEEQCLFARYGLSGFTIGRLHAQMYAALGEDGDATPAQLDMVTAELDKLPGVATWASRRPTQVGQPIALPAGLTVPRVGAAMTVNLLEPVVTAVGGGAVCEVQPASVDANLPFNAVVTVEREGKRQVLSIAVDAAGKVRTVSLLPLDYGCKLEAAVANILSQLAEIGGLKPSVASALYEGCRSKGQAPLAALLTVARELRSQLPPGTRVSTSPISDLAYVGLLTMDEMERANQALASLYPDYEDLALAEKSLFAWLEKVAGPDAAQVHASYAQAFAAGRDYVDALRCAADAVPPARLSGSDPLEVAPHVFALCNAARGWETLGALLVRAQASPAARLRCVLTQAVDPVRSGLMESALAAAFAAVDAALGAGKSPLDAALAAVEQLWTASGLVVPVQDALRGLGLLAEPDAEARCARAYERQLAESRLLDSDIAQRAGCSVEVADAARTAYLAARAAHPGDAVAAVLAWLDALGPVLAHLRAEARESLLPELLCNACAIAPDAAEPIRDAVTKKVGTSIVDAVHGTLPEIPARIFDRALAQHRPFEEALAAGFAALSLQGARELPLPEWLTAGERAACAKATASLATAYRYEAALESLFEKASASQVTAHRERLLGGADPHAECLRFLGGLHDHDLGPEDAVALSCLPPDLAPEKRREITRTMLVASAETFASGMRKFIELGLSETEGMLTGVAGAAAVREAALHAFDAAVGAGADAEVVAAVDAALQATVCPAMRTVLPTAATTFVEMGVLTRERATELATAVGGTLPVFPS